MNRTELLEFANLYWSNTPPQPCEHITVETEIYHACLFHPEIGWTCPTCQFMHDSTAGGHELDRPCDRCQQWKPIRPAPAYRTFPSGGDGGLGLVIHGLMLCSDCLDAVKADPTA